MPEKALIFISCGQFTPDEICLGTEIERFIKEETPFEPYFAEQQNTLEGLVANILSALGRAVGFIGIMHHRGNIVAPDGKRITRGSVWIEQEIAIAAFMQHVLARKMEIVLYLQKGISREGIRSQLRLKPVEFDSNTDVLRDLRARVPAWNLVPRPNAPLIARWNWKLQPGYTGERHEYLFHVELYNSSDEMIDQWKVEIWFPAAFIENADSSGEFVHKISSDTNYSPDAKRIFPGRSLSVFRIPYVVTHANWPGDEG